MKDTGPDYYTRIDPDLCNGCVLCMRRCPTRAIRVRNRERAEIVGFCIDCGECSRVCPRGAVSSVTTGLEGIDKGKTVLVVSPVFYSQFGEEVSPDRINLALKNMGFLDVFDEFEALEAFSTAVELYLEDHKKRGLSLPLLSPVCPVVVRIVAHRFPSLLKHFPPLLRPRELVARDVKTNAPRKYGLSSEEIKVLLVTPCSAKMIAIRNPVLVEESYLDGAVGMNEFYLAVKAGLKKDGLVSNFPPGCGLGIGWGKSGGEIATMEEGNYLAVTGIEETLRYLEKIEMRLLGGIDYVEFRPSPAGCIGGPLTLVDRYEAKHTLERIILKHGARRHCDRSRIEALYLREWYFTRKTHEGKAVKPGGADFSEAIERMSRIEEIYKKLPQKECGVCGSPDCRTFAEDVADGKTSLDECVYLKLYPSP